MSWQKELERELVRRLPSAAQYHISGSALDPDQLDPWSDLDLHVDLMGSTDPVGLFDDLDVWAVSEDLTGEKQVLRAVLLDGRRMDVVVGGGLVLVPSQAADNDIRMLAALAAAKLGRRDHLIGLHLTLELMRSCLVQAMLLRDRDVGTSVHRFGSDRDAMAAEVADLLQGPIGISPRPNIVERTVELYGKWRRQLDPAYEPNWSGLWALTARGLESQ